MQTIVSPRCAARAGGYTYVALLVLLALYGLASAVAVSTASLLQQRANEEELLFVGRQFAAAFRSYYESSPAGNRQFPAKLDDLLRDPRFPGVKRHLRRIYADPMTGAPWGLVAAPGGGIMGVHSVSQRAPLKVASFDADLAGLAHRRKYSEWVFQYAPPPPVVPPPRATPKPMAPVPRQSAVDVRG